MAVPVYAEKAWKERLALKRQNLVRGMMENKHIWENAKNLGRPDYKQKKLIIEARVQTPEERRYRASYMGSKERRAAAARMGRATYKARKRGTAAKKRATMLSGRLRGRAKVSFSRKRSKPRITRR